MKGSLAAVRGRSGVVVGWALVALVVRLVPVVLLDGMVADVATEWARGNAVSSGDNLYAGEFPYSPLPQWLPALAVGVAKGLDWPFERVFKSMLVLADTLTALLLGRVLLRRCNSLRSLKAGCALWALNPVAILVSAFHGNPSSFVALLLTLAWVLVELAPEARRRPALVAAALALGLAIALRSFPVLLIPVFALLAVRSAREAIGFSVLAAAPVVVNALPYLVYSHGPMVTNITTYAGLTDFGWMAALRAAALFAGGPRLGSFDEDLLGASRIGFLVSYVAVLLLLPLMRRAFLGRALLLPFLAFYALYGGGSAQYLVWVLPIALAVAPLFAASFSLVAAATMVLFYVIYHPGILFGSMPPLLSEGPLVIFGYALCNVVLVVVCLAWFARLVFLGLARGEVAPQEAGAEGQPSWLAEEGRAVRRARPVLVVAAGLLVAAVILVLGLRAYRSLAASSAVAHTSTPAPVSDPPERPVEAPALVLPATFERAVDREALAGSGVAHPWSLRVGRGLFVVDFPSHRLVELTDTGGLVRELPLDEGEALGMDVSGDGSLHVLDSSRMVVVVFPPEAGGSIRRIQLEPDGAFNPRGLAVGGDGELLVADTGRRRLLRYSSEGRILGRSDCGDCGLPFGELSDAVVTTDGRVAVADGGNLRVVLLSSELRFLAEVPLPGEGGLEGMRLGAGPAGTALAASLDQIWLVTADGRGALVAGGRATPDRPLGPVGGVAWHPHQRLIWVAEKRDGRLAAFRPGPELDKLLGASD